MRLSEKINGSFSSLFESSYNQAMNESEDYTFQEIIDMMEMAEDYEELKNAASYIKNEKLRKDVEELINQCYVDNDSVETAYSIVTSDLLDMRAYDDNTEILEETTNKQLEAKKQDLYARERQTLKDLGDENWENLVGLKNRLPEEQFDAFMKEEGEIRTIEMIHSILTYTPKENWNVDYVMENKYLKNYINELGEDRVRELAQQEVDEYINNATVEQGTYTDSEGVTYNSTTFKNESEKLTEGTKQKRIARFGEFDNGHILHSWYEMTDEEAEEKAKQASIDDPTDVYYVSYDDIMNPNSGVYWYKGKSYSNEEVIEIRKKEKENIKIKESNSLSKDEILSRIFAKYPDISKEDEDYLNGLPLDGLINEVMNRGWDVLEESIDVISGNELNEETNLDLGDLAKEVFDWYDSDMGTHVDEIQGHEEEVYNDIVAVLEAKDVESINLFINDIEESNKELAEKLKALL